MKEAPMSGDDIDPTADPVTDPPADEWTPPTKEEWEKAQRTAAVRKQERDEARREAAAAKEAAAKAKPGDTDAKLEEAQKASDNRARRSAGLTALVEAGMTRAQAKEALPLVKLDKLTVDQDGDVDEDDLDDAVKSLKEKFPGLFPSNGKPPKARTADGGARDNGTKSATDRTTERIMKAAGLA
jgi:hypothetical protein